MKKLLLKTLRDIKQSKGQFIAIILIIAVGAFFSTGLLTLSTGLKTYTEQYYKENNLSDLYVYYSQISDSDISSLEKIKGINKIEKRITFEGKQKFDDLTTDLKIHSIPKNNEINRSTIIEGSVPTTKNEIMIDSRYAKEHNFNVNDQITINVNNADYKFIISGLCENVEHAYNIKDASLVVPDHKIYGVAYISDESISELFGDTIYNELMIDIDNSYDSEAIGETIEENSKDSNYLYYLTKERTISYSNTASTIASNGSMSIILPLVLFMVASVIIYLTLSRIVDSQRNQIGVMKALGVKNSKIILHYINYSIFVGILGSIIGSILGFVLFTQIGNSQFDAIYSFPDFKLSINVLFAIPTIVLSIVLGIIAAYFSCKKVLKENAAQAMRPKPPKNSKPILLERFPSIWTRLSYGNKLILRNIFLTKQRALFTSCGLIVCVVLLIVAFGYILSMTSLVGKVDTLNKYDLRLDYKTPLVDNSLDLPNFIEDHYLVSELAVQFINSDNTSNKVDTTLLVTEKDNKLIKIHDINSNEISLDYTGVIISRTFANKYKISEGDKIDLSFISPNLKDKSLTANVSKISEQYINDVIYCTPKYLESFDIDFLPSTILVDINDSKSLDDAITTFKENDSIIKVSSISDLKDTITASMEQSYPAMITFIFSAVILAAAAIYTISSINIFDRTRELATLKVLGYQKNKINNLIFRENIMIAIFSAIVALPLGYLGFSALSQALSAADQLAPNKLNIASIIFAITLTLVVTVISNLLLRKKVKKVDMIESLKSIEKK